jgi:hypothetical protein
MPWHTPPRCQHLGGRSDTDCSDTAPGTSTSGGRGHVNTVTAGRGRRQGARCRCHMLANMEVTGRSAEETHAALAQFFLNCPAVDPDAEETKVNVDEFEHTEVEQQARRDQQRVLMAHWRGAQPATRPDGRRRGRSLRPPWTGGVRSASTAQPCRRWISVVRRAS